jgi:hypothetical protein
MSNLLELPCGSSPGKVQDLSQSLEPATNNHQHVPKLLRCSKPSRWRQPPRVIRNPQPQRSPSATKCNHSSKCTWNHSQSQYDDKSMMEMSERCLLRLTRMSSMSKCHESEPQACTFLFIEPLGSKSHWLLAGVTGLTDWMHPSVRSTLAIHVSVL